MRSWLSVSLGILGSITGSILLFSTLAFASLSGSLEEDAIAKRLAPEARVHLEKMGKGPSAGGGSTLSADAGRKRYEATCKMCHGTGVAGAPKLTDKAIWKDRLSEGEETLIHHAIHGYKAMPPKGTCTSCSEDEIRKTVEYMMSQVK